jgi:hypothetical protein
MHWFGFNWFDIILNVLVLAIVPGILAAYGGHLAAEGVGDAKRRNEDTGVLLGSISASDSRNRRKAWKRTPARPYLLEDCLEAIAEQGLRGQHLSVVGLE